MNNNLEEMKHDLSILVELVLYNTIRAINDSSDIVDKKKACQ